MADASTNHNTGRTQRARRVTRACDYCRKKRLKCTPNQHPCLNCQLYDAECTWHDRGRRAVAQAPRVAEAPEARTDDSSRGVGGLSPPLTEHQPHQSISMPLDLAIDAHSELDSLPPPSWAQQSEDHQQQLVDVGHAQHFGSVLRQLGIGVSSNFWELDRSMLDNLADVDRNFANSPSEGNAVALGGLAPNGSVHQQVTSMTAQFSHTPQSTSSANGKVSSIDKLTSTDDNAVGLQESVPPGVFIRKNDAVANYIGMTSVGATLALCLKDAIESQRRPVDANSMGFLIEAGPHVDEAGLSSVFDVSLHVFPPRRAALQSSEAYFRNLNTFYPIVDEEFFRELFELVYSSDRAGLGSLDFSLFYLVISIGTLSHNHSCDLPNATEPSSADGYEHAWSHIHDAIATPCETSLQIILLHIVRHMYFGRCGVAWVFCGFAIRIAESLGLHRRCPEEINLPPRQLRLRSRLWWITLSFDSSLSLSQGRPSRTLDATSEHDVLPIDVDASTHFPSLSDIYSWTYQLSQMQSRFCNLMHSEVSVLSRLAALAQIDDDLVAWRDSLPAACRPDHMILVSPERYLHILVVHLDYLNLLRAVHWAAITLKPACIGSTQISTSRLRASDALCVEAARSLIKRLNDLMDDITGKRVFIVSFQKTNYMAAIATLYRSICMNPSTLSARLDLEHLRAGRIHIQRDTPERVVGPALIKMLDNMVLSAEAVVEQQHAGARPAKG